MHAQKYVCVFVCANMFAPILGVLTCCDRSGTVGFSQGLAEYTAEDYATEVIVPAQPGDIIVHHCLTVHRAGDNKTDRRRASLGFIYYGQSCVQDTERSAAYQAQLYAEWEKEGKI